MDLVVYASDNETSLLRPGTTFAGGAYELRHRHEGRDELIAYAEELRVERQISPFCLPVMPCLQPVRQASIDRLKFLLDCWPGPEARQSRGFQRQEAIGDHLVIWQRAEGGRAKRHPPSQIASGKSVGPMSVVRRFALLCLPKPMPEGNVDRPGQGGDAVPRHPGLRFRACRLQCRPPPRIWVGRGCPVRQATTSPGPIATSRGLALS